MEMSDSFRQRYEEGHRVRIMPEDPQDVRDRDHANLDTDLRHLGDPADTPRDGLVDGKEDE